MKILLIDDKTYGHNQDIHVDFFRYMHKYKYAKICAYGSGMKKYFESAYIPNKENIRKDFRLLLATEKPDAIVSYNSNGSSYEIGFDNVAYFSWLENELRRVSIPKIHITTDFCRSGYKEIQDNWFSDLNYQVCLLRHKASLEHMRITKNAQWFPFSVDEKLYEKKAEMNFSLKDRRVGFVGAAQNSAKELYKNRIAAIEKLADLGLMDQYKGRSALYSEKYVNFLTSHLMGLTCGGTVEYMTAKYFQIPAANSLLLCTEAQGLAIFPEDSYIKYSYEKLDDLERNVREHLLCIDLTKQKMLLLRDYVMREHSHATRAKQLLNIIRHV